MAPTRASEQFEQFENRLDQALNSYNKGVGRTPSPPAQQDQYIEFLNSQIPTSQTQTHQIRNRQDPATETPQKGTGSAIPEELQTAIQWMAEEEVENKLVELLSRQAKLRGVDLS
jgi:predicted metal-dependent hydrolase